MMRRIAVLILASVFALHTGPLFSAVAAAQGQQAPGALQCTARSSTGQPLANFIVQLRNVATGQLVGSTTTSQDGSCGFMALPPGTYVLEIVNAAGGIIGTSAAVTVTAGATVAVTVTTSAAATLTVGAAGGTVAGGGVNRVLLLTTLAGVAGIVAYIVSDNQTEASPSR